MVDQISNNPNAISTLLRAQTVATNVSPVTQKIAATSFNQVVGKPKPTVIQPVAKSLTPPGNLPRGSLVDILA
jgi:hypothetical protein